ncbi:MAG: hypothetical protein H7A25_10140 [Leptospiraceae bacterium]|nr:hypothetical protein [Leptospiraceae bacterium]MCP5500251.1 hypothetical protein [Leptospiraceae bacterium]
MKPYLAYKTIQIERIREGSIGDHLIRRNNYRLKYGRRLRVMLKDKSTGQIYYPVKNQRKANHKTNYKGREEFDRLFTKAFSS